MEQQYHPCRGGICVYRWKSKYQIISIFVTIASKGNAVRFGDLSIFGRSWFMFKFCSRIIWWWIYWVLLTIKIKFDYVTIASEGNAIDFGDLTLHWFGGSAYC